MSVKVTPVAGEGPLFVTVSVYVMLPFRSTGFGDAVFTSDTSAAELTVVVAPDVLLVGLGSNAFEVTEAVLFRVPGAVGLTTMSTVALPALMIAPSGHVTVVVPLQVP